MVGGPHDNEELVLKGCSIRNVENQFPPRAEVGVSALIPLREEDGLKSQLLLF